MTTDRAHLEVRLRGDVSQLQRDLAKVNGDIDRLSGGTRQASAGFSDMALGVAAGGAALGVLTAGVGALQSALVGSVKSAGEAEQAQVKLGAVLRAAGDASGLSRTQLEAYATELQNATGIADEAIMGSQSILLTFRNISGDTFKEATEFAADMSAVFGGDLSSSAMQLGKALNDPIQGIGALRRVGVQLSDQQEAAVKSFVAVNDIASAQKIILEELRNEVGGTARALGDTAAGKTAIFTQKMGDLQEKLGAAVLEGFDPLLDRAIDWADSDEAIKFTEDLATVMGALASATGLAANGVLVLNANWTNFLDRVAPGLGTGLDLLLHPEGKLWSAKGGANTFLLEHPEAQFEADAAGRGSADVDPFAQTLRDVNNRIGRGTLNPEPTKAEQTRRQLEFEATIAQAERDIDAHASALKGASSAVSDYEARMREANKLTEERNLQMAAGVLEQAELAAAAAAREHEESLRALTQTQQWAIGVIQGFNSQGVQRYAPGVFKTIASAGGLNTEFDWYSVDGGPRISTSTGEVLDVAVP